MGLFDKVKGFLNVDGLKVEITKVENPFPVGDIVFKGAYSLTAGVDCSVLSTRATFVLQKRHPDGRLEDLVLGVDDSTTLHNLDVKYPIELKAGDSRALDFCIVQVSIPEALQAMGYPEPRAALGSPDVKFFLRVDADAKNTPFDPVHQVDITVT